MLRNRWPLVLMAASGMLFTWSLALGDKLTPAQIAKRTIPSVVTVRVPTGLGSGFVVGDGLVVTNLHVIGSAQEASVVLADGRELQQPEVLAADEAHDLVVLKVPRAASSRCRSVTRAPCIPAIAWSPSAIRWG